MMFDLDAIGIVSAARTCTFDRYCIEIARGLPPQLSYLEKNADCRRDFEAIMPGTKSVLCCAAVLPVFDPNLPLKYARFCAIGDYHAVMRERLTKLDAWLRQRYPIQNSRICVDSAPVLERELAVRAGIGSTGFNRMVIHPKLGSCIALAELLVDTDLMPYRQDIESNVLPHENDIDAMTPGATCKTHCRLCVKSCPTHALSDDGYDVHKCLSYWTTQHKGVIPEPYATSMEDVIWGCDRCQKNCPRNPKQINPRVSPENNPLNTLTLHEILTLSARKLKMRLAGSCIADAHPYMLVRNAIIIIRNTHRLPEFAQEITTIRDNHPCDWVREQAHCIQA